MTISRNTLNSLNAQSANPKPHGAMQGCATLLGIAAIFGLGMFTVSCQDKTEILGECQVQANQVAPADRPQSVLYCMKAQGYEYTPN